MHAFTLTIHSYFHTKNLSDEELEQITEKYAQLVDGLLKTHELDKHFTTEVYWRRGCLEICFAFFAIEPATWTAALAAAKNAAVYGVPAVWGFFATYDDALSGYNNFKKDLSKKWVNFKGQKVKPSEVHECTSKQLSNAKKLDR